MVWIWTEYGKLGIYILKLEWSGELFFKKLLFSEM